jgi:hypothetical protein
MGATRFHFPPCLHLFACPATITSWTLHRIVDFVNFVVVPRSFDTTTVYNSRLNKMRFLHLIRPVMCVLPEVASPDRKVSFTERRLEDAAGVLSSL